MRISHLQEVPALRTDTAARIHAEFWADKPGFSPAYFEGRLAEASDPQRIPLCRVAHEDGLLLGTANLIDNDDEARPHLWPWLAAVVVVREMRGRGVGSALVSRVLADAAVMGIEAVYLGTDKPSFYRRFGAIEIEKASNGLAIMRCPTALV